MKRLIYLVVSAIFLLVQLEVFASPVNLPQGIKGKEGVFLKEKISDVLDVSGSFLSETISKRKLKDNSAKIKADIIGGQVDFTFVDRIDLYGFFGELQNPEYQATLLGSDVRYELESKSMMGFGLSAVIYEWEKIGIKLFGDGNYRKIKDIDYEAIVIDGVRHEKASLTGLDIKANFEEWQVALGVSKQFKYFVPYLGLKYSDAEVSAKATYAGTTYDSGTTKSKKKVGPFVGVSILPVKGVSIDLGGNFVDEESFTAKVTIKF